MDIPSKLKSEQSRARSTCFVLRSRARRKPSYCRAIVIVKNRRAGQCLLCGWVRYIVLSSRCVLYTIRAWCGGDGGGVDLDTNRAQIMHRISFSLVAADDGKQRDMLRACPGESVCVCFCFASFFFLRTPDELFPGLRCRARPTRALLVSCGGRDAAGHVLACVALCNRRLSTRKHVLCPDSETRDASTSSKQSPTVANAPPPPPSHDHHTSNPPCAWRRRIATRALDECY